MDPDQMIVSQAGQGQDSSAGRDSIPFPTMPYDIELKIGRRDYEVGMVANKTEARYADPAQIIITAPTGGGVAMLDLDGVFISVHGNPQDGLGVKLRELTNQFSAWYSVATENGSHVVGVMLLPSHPQSPLLDPKHVSFSLERGYWALRVSGSWKEGRLGPDDLKVHGMIHQNKDGCSHNGFDRITQVLTAHQSAVQAFGGLLLAYPVDLEQKMFSPIPANRPASHPIG